MKIDKILFATDYSANSLTAFEYALSMAKNFNAELDIVHSYLNKPRLSKNLNAIVDEDVKTKVEEMEKLDEYMNKLYEEFNINSIPNLIIEYKLLKGGASEQIIMESKVRDSDVIVLGSSGEGDSKTRFGSVAKKVAHNSHLPVFVIPKGTEFRPIKEILFLDDYEQADYDDLELLTQISDFSHARFTILHFQEPLDYSRKYRNMVFKDLEKRFKDNPKVVFQLNKECRVSKLKCILDHIHANDIDIVSLKKRNTVADVKSTLVDSLMSSTDVPCIIF